MKVRIGVAESSKVVESEIEDLAAFKESVADAVDAGKVFWTTDSKGREVGIPAGKIAFVEIELENSDVAVGFAPAG